MFDYVWSEKFKFLVSEKAAGEADKNTEVNDLNETAAEEEECSSIRLTNDSSARKHPRDWPAPEWFCEALGTSLGPRSFHGNVRFLISDPLARCMNYPDNIIGHHKFIRQLWIYMSYLPLNRKHFDPVNTDFASVFGINIVKWADLRTCLQEHVYFKSSLVGVFSGQKMPGAS